MRIAVVDDEQGILLTLRLFLEMEGHTPLVFSSPIEALSVLSTEPVDLIILDMRMPEINGEEMAIRLRNHPATRETPIILFSAHESLTDVAVRVGAHGILEKPFQFDKLNRLINSVAGTVKKMI